MKYKFKTPPYSHQLSALERSWNKETFAYFMEMGTGKTKVLIDNVAMLYDKGKIDGALIIAPKGVMGTWRHQELPAHLPTHIESMAVMWQANITNSQSRLLGQLFKTDEKLHILIMNVEALSTQKGKDFATKFMLSHKTLMAIDESTTIKNPKAKRTKNILTISRMASYRRILTGSPVTRNPLDLYSQCEFLDINHLGHQSYYSFRTRYALMRSTYINGRSINLVVGFQRLDELSENLKSFSYRVLKADCLDLPPKIYMKREISLSDEQNKVYKEMKHHNIEFIGIAVWDEEEKIRDFIKEFNVNYPNLVDANGRVAIDYGVRGVPEKYLINREGFLVSKIGGPISYERLRNMLLPMID